MAKKTLAWRRAKLPPEWRTVWTLGWPERSQGATIRFRRDARPGEGRFKVEMTWLGLRRWWFVGSVVTGRRVVGAALRNIYDFDDQFTIAGEG